MTIVSLLDAMSVFNNELNTGSGQSDEARCLTALDIAQDLFESIVATYPNMLGTDSTMTTTANQEYTTWPAALMRLDDLWMLDANSVPQYPMREIKRVGGHAAGQPWIVAAVTVQPGKPSGYWTNRAKFFWDRTPDTVYTLRWYGLGRATDITTRGQTFAYPDEVRAPMAAFAVKVLRSGLDDPLNALQTLAGEFFAPVLKELSKPTRTAPTGRRYMQTHST